MYLGIDIGGTGMKYGVLSGTELLLRGSVPTPNTPEAILEALVHILQETQGKIPAPLQSIGIGIPGFVDKKDGRILFCSNLPLEQYPLAEKLRKITPLPVFVENDANCAALGEYSVNPRHPQHMILLTLGTGIGGGILLNGALYTGSHGFAGELGHMVIHENGKPCPCGKRGCFEQYASATALTQMALEHVYSDSQSPLKNALLHSSGKPNAKVVFDCVRAKDRDAEQILDRFASQLAVGIENLVDIFDPDEIVLAGGITHESDILIEYLNRYTNKRCPVYFSVLKNDAGLIGAARLGAPID